MYTSINYNSPRKNYKHKSNYTNHKNKVKILEDTTIDGKFIIEISYIKEQGIYYKQLNIDKNNIDKVITRFKNNNFLIETPNSINLSTISNIENISTTYSHYEYRANQLNNFKRQAYNNSFKQKYK